MRVFQKHEKRWGTQCSAVGKWLTSCVSKPSRNPQNMDLLYPKSGPFEPHPLNPPTNTPFLAHFVTSKSGPFRRRLWACLKLINIQHFLHTFSTFTYICDVGDFEHLMGEMFGCRRFMCLMRRRENYHYQLHEKTPQTTKLAENPPVLLKCIIISGLFCV